MWAYLGHFYGLSSVIQLPKTGTHFLSMVKMFISKATWWMDCVLFPIQCSNTIILGTPSLTIMYQTTMSICPPYLAPFFVLYRDQSPLASLNVHLFCFIFGVQEDKKRAFWMWENMFKKKQTLSVSVEFVLF